MYLLVNVLIKLSMLQGAGVRARAHGNLLTPPGLARRPG